MKILISSSSFGKVDGNAIETLKIVEQMKKAIQEIEAYLENSSNDRDIYSGCSK